MIHSWNLRFTKKLAGRFLLFMVFAVLWGSKMETHFNMQNVVSADCVRGRDQAPCKHLFHMSSKARRCDTRTEKKSARIFHISLFYMQSSDASYNLLWEPKLSSLLRLPFLDLPGNFNLFKPTLTRFFSASLSYRSCVLKEFIMAAAKHFFFLSVWWQKGIGKKSISEEKLLSLLPCNSSRQWENFLPFARWREKKKLWGKNAENLEGGRARARGAWKKSLPCLIAC